MDLPFKPEQFFNIFARYNVTVWPMQIIIYGLALIALYFTLKETIYSDRIISTILACLWLWIGLVYHLVYFTSINRAAYLFGGLFIIQGVLFFISGVWWPKISFKPHLNFYSILGGIFILYGTVIYPILGRFLGHVYPYSPTFGLPCPTTIFTFGLLLWADNKIPKHLLVIPLVWSLVGFLAAIQLGVLEDVMLLITGLVATTMIWYRDKMAGKLAPSFS